MPSAVESPLVYFLHIPKTSGTSLTNSFLRAFSTEDATYTLLWDHLIKGTYQLSERTRIITGHFGGFLPLWLRSWPRIVTILRDPVARALSHINHVQRDPRHPLHALAAGLTVVQYCEHPSLRKTIDNFQSRYLASLDFALALVPRSPYSPGSELDGSISVGFENALCSLDKETGLLDAAIRALDAIDAVGICEMHGPSLHVFARALGWDVEIVEFESNSAAGGQRTLEVLSGAEMDALASLNLIDAQVYSYARGRFSELCRRYAVELDERQRAALTQPTEGLHVAGDAVGERAWGLRESPSGARRATDSTGERLFHHLRGFANGAYRRTRGIAKRARSWTQR